MAYFGCINKSSSPPTPPEPNYLYKWDFTKSVDPLVDEIEGKTFAIYANNNHSPYLNENGINFIGQSAGYGCGYAFSGALNESLLGKVIEIDFGNTNIGYVSSSIRAVISFVTYGFIFADAQSNCWGIRKSNSGGWNYLSTDYPPNIVSNKTMKITIDNAGGIDLYVVDNGNEVKITPNKITMPDGYISNFLYLGATEINRTVSDFIVKAVRIYENEEV